MKKHLHPIVLPSLEHYTFKNLFSKVNVSKFKKSNYRQLLVLETGADLIACVSNHHLRFNRKVQLLLPEVFCSSTLRFVRGLNVSINFYVLNNDFSPNKDSVLQELIPDGFNIMVFVHFFGHYQPSIHNIKKHLSQENVVILEDLAHFPFLPKKTEFHGDYLLFSPRKHLPISAGALLFSKEKIEVNFTRKPNYTYELFWTLSNLFKRYVHAFSWKKAPVQQDISALKSETAELRPRHVSNYNQNFINKQFLAEPRGNCVRRVNNLKKLQHIIEEHFDSGAAVTFLSQEIPYGIPILLDTADKRQKALRLKEIGLPVMIWPDFPAEAIIKIGKENLVGRRVALFICHEQIDLKKCLEKISLVTCEASCGYSNC